MQFPQFSAQSTPSADYILRDITAAINAVLNTRLRELYREIDSILQDLAHIHSGDIIHNTSSTMPAPSILTFPESRGQSNGLRNIAGVVLNRQTHRTPDMVTTSLRLSEGQASALLRAYMQRSGRHY